MRTSILINAAGAILNAKQNILINASPVNGQAASSLFQNQITLEFYNAVVQDSAGNYQPSGAAVTAGLTGTISFTVYSSANSPYPVTLQNASIDISVANILQYYGITEALVPTATSVVGAAYCNILLDRG
jgi:hypothetical protein